VIGSSGKRSPWAFSAGEGLAEAGELVGVGLVLAGFVIGAAPTCEGFYYSYFKGNFGWIASCCSLFGVDSPYPFSLFAYSFF
jgi:hypothetical protein